MQEPVKKKNPIRWYQRGFGMFAGAILGLVVVGLPLLLIDQIPFVVMLLMIVLGAVGGMAVGYFFPSATEAILWMIGLFQ